MDHPLIGFASGDSALLGFALLGSVPEWMHWVLPILGAAVALGFVIFVHELGHFVVAKLCGVKCEKFFLGFDIAGKKLWSMQWGETEYGIGVLPLGGYVKMLGQDDNPANAAEERERAKAKTAAAAAQPPVGNGLGAVPPEAPASPPPPRNATEGAPYSSAAQPAGQPAADEANAAKHRSGGDIPHEPTAEEHEAFDPRSYMAKSVPQRMAIISAGVIMNLIFAVIFAAIAYRCGVSYTPCVIGAATPGDPAWVQGVRPGDKIVQFDNDKPSQQLRYFEDLLPNVIFTGSSGELKLGLERPAASPTGSPKPIDVVVQPTDAHKKEVGGHSVIGVLPAESNQLAPMEDSASPTIPDSPAAAAEPAFEGGDRIVEGKVGSAKYPLQNGVQIEALLAQHADQPIKFTVLRGPENDPTIKPKELAIHVSPALWRDLGIVMQMGPIKAVQKGSPADVAKLQVGDVIKSVEGRPVEDGMLLPEQLAKLAGKQITIEVARTEAGRATTIALHVTPRPPLDYDRAGSNPFGCDALGIAYPILNTVGSVRSDATADAKKLQAGDIIVSAEFVPTEEQKKQFDETVAKFPSKPIQFDDEHLMWPALEGMLQMYPSGVTVKLTFKRGDKEMSAMPSSFNLAGEFYPGRGLLLRGMSEIRKADSWSEATELGWRETKESVMQIVTTVRKIASGGISPNGLGGPGTIAVVAAASASQGIPKLLIFLTLLSANLAVINFLPIPILDGGHMMFLLYEGIRGKPASERVQMYLTYLGLVLILTLMVFVIGLDISRFVKWIISRF